MNTILTLSRIQNLSYIFLHNTLGQTLVIKQPLPPFYQILLFWMGNSIRPGWVIWCHMTLIEDMYAVNVWSGLQRHDVFTEMPGTLLEKSRKPGSVGSFYLSMWSQNLSICTLQSGSQTSSREVKDSKEGMFQGLYVGS